MKKRCPFFHSWLAVIGVAIALSSCQEQLDLGHIDTRIKADFGLALPIGNMLVTTNDFLGNRQIKTIGVDQDGIFHLIDTFQLANTTFPLPNVSLYVDSVKDDFKLKNKLENIEVPGIGIISVLDDEGNLIDLVKGYSLPIKFTKTVQLNGVNQQERGDKIRLDKANVKSARFTTKVTPKDMDQMLWSYIDTVAITFNSQFEMGSGNNTVVVYAKGDPRGGYGKVMPIDIEDFVLNLMKQAQEEPGWNNVVDTIELTFMFRFTVPKNQQLHISETSAFSYDFHSKKIDYAAIYGWFGSEETTHSHQTVTIDSIYGGSTNIDSLFVKLAEPSLHIGVSHHMSVPMTIGIDTFMTKNKTQQAWATWDNSRQTTFYLDNVIAPIDNPTDSAWNFIRMNHLPSNGHLDNLFSILPDSLVLGFNVGIDASTTHYSPLQHRITDQNRVSSYAAVDIPFKLNTGSKLVLKDKIVDVDIKKFSIDSLLKDVKVLEQGKVKTLKMALQFTNSLPFKIDAKVKFLRQDKSVMDLSIFAGQTLNELYLPAPEMTPGNPYGKVSQPSVSTYILDLNEQQLDSLVNIKHLQIDFYVGDNPEPCIISNTSSIQLAVGLATSVETIINPSKK